MPVGWSPWASSPCAKNRSGGLVSATFSFSKKSILRKKSRRCVLCFRFTWNQRLKDLLGLVRRLKKVCRATHLCRLQSATKIRRTTSHCRATSLCRSYNSDIGFLDPSCNASKRCLYCFQKRKKTQNETENGRKEFFSHNIHNEIKKPSTYR